MGLQELIITIKINVIQQL